MCVRTQSVNSKPLPHLKGIRKDGTSLQLDNKIKAKITTNKNFFFFFSNKTNECELHIWLILSGWSQRCAGRFPAMVTLPS